MLEAIHGNIHHSITILTRSASDGLLKCFVDKVQAYIGIQRASWHHV